LGSRLASIHKLSARWLVREESGERSVTLRYQAAAAGELESLVELERECCAFLSFELSRDAEGVELRIEAPADAGPFASKLFEHFRAAKPIARGCGGGACGCAAA
jgi:methylaspartate ammonia-lyase